MDISKIAKKYDVEFYIKVLLFKNNSNFGVYHDIGHYLSVISNVEKYCVIENLDDKVTRNLIIASIFHDFNRLSSRTDDENTKNAIEGFIRHSIENKTDNFLISTILINLESDSDEIYGITNKLYAKAISLLKSINLVGLYLDCDANDVIQYVMKLSHEKSVELETCIRGEINLIENYKCKIKSIVDDISSKSGMIIKTLNWLLEKHQSTTAVAPDEFIKPSMEIKDINKPNNVIEDNIEEVK